MELNILSDLLRHGRVDGEHFCFFSSSSIVSSILFTSWNVFSQTVFSVKLKNIYGKPMIYTNSPAVWYDYGEYTSVATSL